MLFWHLRSAHETASAELYFVSAVVGDGDGVIRYYFLTASMAVVQFDICVSHFLL